jgi:hypothetical protein
MHAMNFDDPSQHPTSRTAMTLGYLAPKLEGFAIVQEVAICNLFNYATASLLEDFLIAGLQL